MTYLRDWTPTKEKTVTQPEQPKASKEFLNLNSWYAPQPNTTGGKPSTAEEEAFILDYMQNYGTPPDPREVSTFMNNRQLNAVAQGKQNTENYLPGSLMYEMGFRTNQDYINAQRQGESYGGYAGSQVPQGGLVTYDEQGNPFRNFNLNQGNARANIAQGRYVPPSNTSASFLAMLRDAGIDLPDTDYQNLLRDYSTEELLTDEGLSKRVANYKNLKPTDVYPGMPEAFKVPTIEDALKGLKPNDVYKARLQDYLEQKIVNDKPMLDKAYTKLKDVETWFNDQIADLQEKAAAKEIDEKEYNRLALMAQKQATAFNDYWSEVIDNAMDWTKAKSLISQADVMTGQNYAPESFPLWKEVQNAAGGNTWNLANNAANEMYQTFVKNSVRPAGGGGGQQVSQPSQGEYLTYVESLNVAPQYRQYMMDNYYQYLELWKRRGQGQPFTGWLNDYLANGGQ
jgi:hypothetical protein